MSDLELTMMRRVGELNKEVARLKAEVERLTNNCNYLDQKLDEELDKSAMLCGQVGRLTKELENTDCMFAMASAFARDWNAAKEGKGQP